MAEEIFSGLFRKKGFGRRILVAILVVAWLPLLITGGFLISGANTVIQEKEQEYQLRSSAAIKYNIDQFVKSTVKSVSQFGANPKLVEQLHRYKASRSEQSSRKYVLSEQWHNISDDYGILHRSFLSLYNYYDIYLVNPEGDVLFSTRHDSNLGTNFVATRNNTGKVVHPGLLRGALNKAKQTNNVQFTDLNHYAPAGNIPLGFFSLAISDSQSHLAGYLVVAVPLGAHIASFIEEVETGENSRFVVFGRDGKIRMGATSNAGHTINTQSPLVADWLVQNPSRLLKVTTWGQAMEAVYQTSTGGYVAGTLTPLSILGVELALLGETMLSRSSWLDPELRKTTVFSVGLATLFILFAAYELSKRIVQPLRRLTHLSTQLAKGSLDRVNVSFKDQELIDLSEAMDAIVSSFNKVNEENVSKRWLEKNRNQLFEVMHGHMAIDDFCNQVLAFLVNSVNAVMGAFYVVNSRGLGERDESLYLAGSYAFGNPSTESSTIIFGEGYIGQCAKDQRLLVLEKLDTDFVHVAVGMGHIKPAQLLVLPLVYNEKSYGVIELMMREKISDQKLKLLEAATESIAVALNSNLTRSQLEQKQVSLSVANKVLEQQTSRLVESETNLKLQQTTLEDANRRLQTQTDSLTQSESKLKVQQDALRATNLELEEKANQLTGQKKYIEQQNQELELASLELSERAEEIERSSRYKSEFLANMSHELRTPLNSILLLSDSLIRNDEGLFDEDDMESLCVINQGGKDLLLLINDILDLAKIEAGRMDLVIDTVSATRFLADLKSMFMPLAIVKKILLECNIVDGFSPQITSDCQRLKQVVRNLLSNAIKFTETGSVTVTIRRPFSSELLAAEELEDYIAIEVKDTGIGISEKNHKMVFEPFRQADGSTSRIYGGTGLGLSITQSMLMALKGRVELISSPGQGSTFIVVIPQAIKLDSTSDKPIWDRVEISKADDITMVSATSKGSITPSTKIINNSQFVDGADPVAEMESKFYTEQKEVGRAVDCIGASELSALSESSGSSGSSDEVDKLHPVKEQPTEIVETEKIKNILDHKRILLVDNDLKNSFVLSRELRAFGLRVDIADDGLMALEKLGNYNSDFDLILMEVDLPIMDGSTAMKLVRDNIEYKHLPVIAITSDAVKHSRSSCIDAGASDFMTKPLDLPRLESMIRFWIQLGASPEGRPHGNGNIRGHEDGSHARH